MDEPMDSGKTSLVKRLPTLELAQLLREGRPARLPVAREAHRLYRWDDFRRHVAGCCFQLRSKPGGRWLLNCKSSYAFSVGLLALWHTGRTVVLPPNQQPESLREASKGVRGILSDGLPMAKALPHVAPLACSQKLRRWRELDPWKCFLVLWTSGSTGRRKAVIKTLGRMQKEVTVIEKTFGHLLGSGMVMATVSHQHIYGFLCRLLWPLCAGRAFSDETFLFWEELFGRLPRIAGSILISSPSHLERLTPSGAKALAGRKGLTIFSAGAPLAQTAVVRIARAVGRAPIELLGSTETGVIAWQQWRRSATQRVWRPMEGVRVSVDHSHSDRLTVVSPYIGAPGGRFLLGDSGIVHADGTFLLRGRQDRIVKIAEKRISLDDIENRLQRHRWVDRARVMPLSSPYGHSRTALGAAILLKAGGKVYLQRKGEATLSKVFREFLHKRLDWSTIPRSFRFLDTWPLDSLGKFSQERFSQLFEGSSEIWVRSPEKIGETVTRAKLVRDLRVPSNLSYLEGHFPKYPIVPGVVQLAWVVEAAAEWLGERPIVRRMDAVKFKNVLLPGQRFSLEVTRTFTRTCRNLDFSLTCGDVRISSGRLVLRS